VHQYGTSEATMYSILKNGDKIKTNLEASVQLSGNIACVRHHKLIFERKKKVSCIWLEDGAQKMLSVNGCCGDGVSHADTATVHSLGVRGMSASMSLKSGLKT